MKKLLLIAATLISVLSFVGCDGTLQLATRSQFIGTWQSVGDEDNWSMETVIILSETTITETRIYTSDNTQSWTNNIIEWTEVINKESSSKSTYPNGYRLEYVDQNDTTWVCWMYMHRDHDKMLVFWDQNGSFTRGFNFVKIE